MVRDKARKKCYIIDVSCPNDINVSQKEQEKITKYSGLRLELGRMWDCECIVIPIVIGGLGVVSESFEKYNKAGYTATPVACWWAGAMIEASGAFGQEQ